MKRILVPTLLTLIFFVSCTSESSDNDQPKEDTNSSDELQTLEDTLAAIENMSLQTGSVTLMAMVDGPDEEFWVEGSDDYTQEEIDAAETIDIVPYIYGADSGNEVYPEMKTIAMNHFSFYYSVLSEYTGHVNLYYDQQKEHLTCSFDVVAGDPDGSCTVYLPSGEIFIERVYEEGTWMYSGKEPYAVDWTYDQSTSSLIVVDTDNGITNDTLVELMLSMHDDDWVYFDQIVDKASFERPFLVNGMEFTGRLMAYQHPTYSEEGLERFELNFKNGYLHGDIKIYEWWGDLTLHEIFNNGELEEVVYQMDPSMMDGVAKPIIYLYPEVETAISVSLDFDGRLTHTYPAYHHGWEVTASTDGTLKDENGKEYYALYWEGKETTPLTIPNGTVLKGNETVVFLEEELPKMGLNAREANEFIIYWLPFLENNPYNLIHFASAEYTDMAQLNITPQPETMIRVMMVFQPLDHAVEIEPQNLSELYMERKGFTVVEWGGRLIRVES
jgi:hypothetical protein